MEPIKLEIFRNTPYIYQFHATGQVYHSWCENLSLAQGESMYLEMRQAGDKLVHVIDYILKSNSSSIELGVYKNATFTQGDQLCNWSSYNQMVSKSPNVELYDNPTSVSVVGADQTFKAKEFGSSLGGTSFSNVAIDMPLEDLLEIGEPYLIEITNNDSQTRAIFFELVWYESGN